MRKAAATRYGLPPFDPAGAHRWLYRMPAARLGDFTLGVIAGLLLRRARRAWTPSPVRDRILSPLLTWLPLAVTLALMAWPDRPHYYASLDAMWLIPAVALCLGLGLYPRSALGRFLGIRPLVFLGEVSFAFYLVHRPIMTALDADTIGQGGPLRYAVTMLLICLLITVVAIGCHYLWERPAQRFLNGRLRMKTGPAAVPAQPQPQPQAAEPARHPV